MKKILYTFLSAAALVGCSQDNDLAAESSVEDKAEQKEQSLNTQNDLDKYLEQKIAKPFNINILYRFTDNERYEGYSFVPTDYQKAIEFANVFHYLFIEPYVKIKGQNFLKEYSFSKIILVGEYAYEAGGTYVLGWASAGKKIHLLNINNLESHNIYQLTSGPFQTLYHEVAHTWHQAKLYPTSFDRITASDYKYGNWTNLVHEEALKSGFIQPYCAYNADEDFVETIARYMVYYNATQDCGCATTDQSRWGRAYRNKDLDSSVTDAQHLAANVTTDDTDANVAIYRAIPDGFDREQYTAWKAKFSNYGDASGTYYSTKVWEEELKKADEKIRPTETYTGKEKLEQKMVIIKKYLQDEWQLDLDVLRKEVRSRYPYVVGKDFEGNTVPRKDFSTLNLN